jgi:outer membrane protein assembly factor BamB
MLALTAALAMLAAGPSRAFESVLTHHYDNLRTGWNSQETVLTPANVGTSQFQLLQSVPLDGQVDAQPLVVAAANPSQYPLGVIYVATENNSIYAIDAATGAVLLQRQIGTPVVVAKLPSSVSACNNNDFQIGINSTPVADPATRRLYVIDYSLVKGSPAFRVHALSLETLADLVPPTVVSASSPLQGSVSYSFSATASRQRAALLSANGTLYAGFSSFCDFAPKLERGWLLGWREADLSPLPSTFLVDRRAHTPGGAFRSSIWMSGNGPAADASGRVFVVTGNSDKSGVTYDPMLNPSESVLAMAPDLSSVSDYFTPVEEPFDYATLDRADRDFGSGGVMLLPSLAGSPVPNLAAAAGKAAQLYLLDQAALGGLNAGGPDKVVGRVTVGACWTGPSFFQGADGVGRIVTSCGRGGPMVWQIKTSPKISLVRQFVAPAFPTGEDEGYFTSVSSNGTTAQSQIIWAVSRPTTADPAEIELHAFDATTGAALATLAAGTWPNLTANANIVPVVANGRVFVASYRQLAIFGLSRTESAARLAHPARVRPAPLARRLLIGTVRRADARSLDVESRDGAILHVDIAGAAAQGMVAEIDLGQPVIVQGDPAPGGRIRARSVLKAKPYPAQWEADR